ncbi:hypothetical protein [Halobacillus campisalis]|uniref:Uncharacterized protein n=1 Tax=Halobacillus campisalis TaxID=435909 RepID=A0ABW2K807_9BACI|nr:hypothetical protein [Halobacillus campisalis]
MREKEYRLRNKSDEIPHNNRKIFHKEVESFFDQIKSSKSEALLVGRIIYLPSDPGLENQSTLKFSQPTRNRIDYISQLPNKEMQESMKELSKELDLKQGQLNKIIKEFKKELKSLSELKPSPQDPNRLLKEITEKVVNEEQVKNYVRNIHVNCDKLIDCLFLENFEILDNQTKQEVLDKINVLQSFIEDLKKEMFS